MSTELAPVPLMDAELALYLSKVAENRKLMEAIDDASKGYANYCREAKAVQLLGRFLADKDLKLEEELHQMRVKLFHRRYIDTVAHHIIDAMAGDMMDIIRHLISMKNKFGCPWCEARTCKPDCMIEQADFLHRKFQLNTKIYVEKHYANAVTYTRPLSGMYGFQGAQEVSEDSITGNSSESVTAGSEDTRGNEPGRDEVETNGMAERG